MVARRRFRILFVGAIDGRPELEFLTVLRRTACDVYITSYQAVCAELNRLARRGIHISGDVDATNLLASFPMLRFDAIVWIGPTNDMHLSGTAQLVDQFVRSAVSVLVPGGVVFVIQDLKTPNFRGILELPGAFFCCSVSLTGRTQTQHSAARRVMANRSDQLVAFTFAGGQVFDLNNERNRCFIALLTMIMTAKNWKGRYTKKEIADLIFAYADNIKEDDDDDDPPPGKSTALSTGRKD